VSKYLRQIIFKTDFDGDTVTVTMNPMATVDALAFRAGESETGLAQALQPLMAKYLVSVEGLRAADGVDVSKDEFLSSLYFLPLLVQAGLELMNASRVQNPTPPAS
jgi:hypothetical protein